jgi:hypothetical protein
MFTFSRFVICTKHITPPKCDKAFLSNKEANKIQLEVINGHLEFVLMYTYFTEGEMPKDNTPPKGIFH